MTYSHFLLLRLPKGVLLGFKTVSIGTSLSKAQPFFGELNMRNCQLSLLIPICFPLRQPSKKDGNPFQSLSTPLWGSQLIIPMIPYVFPLTKP